MKYKMIKKLSQKIFFLIMVSLTIIIIGIIILFAVLNYTNTINSRVSMMNRFSQQGEIRKNPNEKLPVQNGEGNINSNIEIEGLYNVVIEDSQVIQISNTAQDKEIIEYALKVSKQDKESGIIGDYIYKIRKTKEQRVYVTLMEDKNAIAHIKEIFVLSVLLSIISFIVIYIIAKKVSMLIVKPVEETFEKQKQFISDASHELKTPLAVIEANADVLENKVGESKWLNYIQTEIESMNKLINELLLLTKIENIDSIKEFKPFDVSKEIQIIFAMFESIAYEKNIKFNAKIQENIILNGNKEDIEHILSTLIDNAIKHTEAKKEVEIEAKKEKNEIIIQVKNEGEPIPEEERKKIFERFYRIDKARSRQEKRYGLGLAIAKSTVDKYNGNIEVTCKDGFTIFKVSIPI
ncbi:MAG: sensor histidine kinase [Clostridia bacterium]